MAVAHDALLTRRREQLDRVLAHRLEHRGAAPTARRDGSHERGVEQVVERRRDVQAGVHDRLDGVERRRR